MRILIPVIALLAAACSPMQTRDTGWQSAGGDLTETATQIACEQRGGTLEHVGRLQSFKCVVPYADAGKTCTDGDQCQGDCRVEGNDGLNAGANVTGQCQASSNGFGCFTRVEDGKATATLCVD